MKYYLQIRWRLENNKLEYYGLRNKKNLFKNSLKLTKNQVKIIKELPKELSDQEIRKVRRLINTQIVKKTALRTVPTSIQEARFCQGCVANDFIIPGIEFDEKGFCPLCQTADLHDKLISVLPVKNIISRAENSDFDIGLFYTGGKDSTYLLYYLSKVLKLRVIAMTWEIPFMSKSAKSSIENAKRKLDNVKFVTKKTSDEELRKIYKKLYLLNENTCACPSLAYLLFYPLLVKYKVPYFVGGNEPVQMLGLYYNGMAPKIAYRFSNSKLAHFLINVGRVITFRRPYKSGQLHTIMTMKQLAYGDNWLKRISSYKNELIENVVLAINEVPELLIPFKKAIKESIKTGNIPRFIHIDLAFIAGGKYHWETIKDLIIEECGWVAPEKINQGLHTSCTIESCKEYSQFQRFYYQRSKMIPFSSLEIALASKTKSITKEEAIKELKEVLGFSLTEIKECQIMKDYLKVSL